jgi:uncharacterized membrane protein YoaK (UPF0700 family)
MCRYRALSLRSSTGMRRDPSAFPASANFVAGSTRWSRRERLISLIGRSFLSRWTMRRSTARTISWAGAWTAFFRVLPRRSIHHRCGRDTARRAVADDVDQNEPAAWSATSQQGPSVALHHVETATDDPRMSRESGSEGGRTRIVRYLRSAVIDERDGPLPAMLLTLTVLVGVVDATSILLAHVFVATMTGNVVFLGLAIAGAPGFSIARSALPIVAFACGALLGGRAFRAAGVHRGRAFRNVLAVKSLLAAAVTVVVVVAHAHFDARTRDYVVVLLAISMGSQLAAIRYLAVRDLPTVVLTLVMTGALIDRGRRLSDPVMLRRVLAIAAFLIGVTSGGLLVRHVSVVASLGLGLAIIVGVAIAAHRASRDAQAAWAIRR